MYNNELNALSILFLFCNTLYGTQYFLYMFCRRKLRLRNNVEGCKHVTERLQTGMETGVEVEVIIKAKPFVISHRVRGLPEKLSNRQFTNVGTHFSRLSFIFHRCEETVVSASLTFSY